MNNVKTKFIIAVSQRLAAAPDSDAKTDLIEELSENLYARYTDMVSAGVPEQEAYDKALGELGDVNELLAWLDGAAPGGEWSGRGPDMKDFANDMLESVRGVVKGAVGIAREAVDTAAEAIKEQGVSFTAGDGSIHFTSAGDGGYSRFTGPTGDLQFFVDEDTGLVEIPSAGIRAINVGLADGDVTVRQNPDRDVLVTLDSDPQSPVRLNGDTKELELRLGEDGTLFIRQGKTASSSFFFGRMLRSTDIELTLPRRAWERLSITTASGEVTLREGLNARLVSVATASGDVEIAPGLECQRMEVRTASGDLRIRDACFEELTFRSASGDLDGDGLNGPVRAETMSGDIELAGCFPALHCSTASGDVEVCTGVLPGQLEVSSKSGDCEVAVPDGAGFTVQFRTVSGELHSDFPLTGPVGKRSGSASYLDGGERTFRMSSISGDLSLRHQPT